LPWGDWPRWGAAWLPLEKRVGASLQPAVRCGGADGPAGGGGGEMASQAAAPRAILALAGSAWQGGPPDDSAVEDRDATHTRSREVGDCGRRGGHGVMGPVEESECEVSSWRATEEERWCGAKRPGCLQDKVGTGSQGMPMNAKKWTGRAIAAPDRPRTSQVGAELTKWKQAPAARGWLVG